MGPHATRQPYCRHIGGRGCICTGRLYTDDSRSSRPMSTTKVPSAVSIALNGKPRSVPPGLTVSGLLADLQLEEDRVAVELDRAILRRSAWASTELREGASLEVVHFVGGG